MDRRSALLVVVGLMGCKPMNATVDEGSYKVFLSTSTSTTLFEERLDLDAFPEHYQIDCRSGDDLDLLDDALDICGELDPDHETWLTFDGYEVVGGPLEPWRGEAIITSEGDLQLTFHQALPSGEDFRFAFVVDRAFQPTECALGAEGTTVRQAIDGDWLGNWSADAEEGTLFYLNAGAYQFNPSNVEVQWTLPDEWLAGFAAARFSGEDMNLRSVRYGKPKAYAAYELEETEIKRQDLFYSAVPVGVDPAQDPDYQALIGSVEGIRDAVVAEFASVNADVAPVLHTNEWRASDGNAPGLDGWVELHYNYVRFDQDRADLAVGDAASGEFHLVFDGFDSQSRAVVRGRFSVDEIKSDRWTVSDLRRVKAEQSGEVLCGQ